MPRGTRNRDTKPTYLGMDPSQMERLLWRSNTSRSLEAVTEPVAPYEIQNLPTKRIIRRSKHEISFPGSRTVRPKIVVATPENKISVHDARTRLDKTGLLVSEAEFTTESCAKVVARFGKLFVLADGDEDTRIAIAGDRTIISEELPILGSPEEIPAELIFGEFTNVEDALAAKSVVNEILKQSSTIELGAVALDPRNPQRRQ